jgi:hypothetical protein
MEDHKITNKYFGNKDTDDFKDEKNCMCNCQKCRCGDQSCQDCHCDCDCKDCRCTPESTNVCCE